MVRFSSNNNYSLSYRHTTLVVFDKEIFYGDGITEQAVGKNEVCHRLQLCFVICRALLTM